MKNYHKSSDVINFACEIFEILRIKNRFIYESYDTYIDKEDVMSIKKLLIRIIKAEMARQDASIDLEALDILIKTALDEEIPKVDRELIEESDE